MKPENPFSLREKVAEGRMRVNGLGQVRLVVTPILSILVYFS
jgi:hypothetical protein